MEAAGEVPGWLSLSRLVSVAVCREAAAAPAHLIGRAGHQPRLAPYVDSTARGSVQGSVLGSQSLERKKKKFFNCPSY